MSTLDEKLEHVELRRGRARRKLDSLRRAGRFEVLAGTPAQPELVRICPMDTWTVWRRVDSSRAATAEFEHVPNHPGGGQPCRAAEP